MGNQIRAVFTLAVSRSAEDAGFDDRGFNPAEHHVHPDRDQDQSHETHDDLLRVFAHEATEKSAESKRKAEEEYHRGGSRGGPDPSFGRREGGGDGDDRGDRAGPTEHRHGERNNQLVVDDLFLVLDRLNGFLRAIGFMTAIAATTHHAHPDAKDDQAACGLKGGDGDPENLQQGHAAEDRQFKNDENRQAGFQSGSQFEAGGDVAGDADENTGVADRVDHRKKSEERLHESSCTHGSNMPESGFEFQPRAG